MELNAPEQGLRALTLHTAWSWLMAKGIKRIENRSWAPPAWLYGYDFALHAGLHEDPKARELATKFNIPIPERVPRGSIVAVVRLVSMIKYEPLTRSISASRPVSLYSGYASPPLPSDEQKERWFFGPCGWLVDEVRELPEPVAVRGFHGLWNIPASQLAEVKRQLSQG